MKGHDSLVSPTVLVVTEARIKAIKIPVSSRRTGLLVSRAHDA